MKKFAVVLSLMVISTAGQGFAQIPDYIGIFLDENDVSPWSTEVVLPIGTSSAYLTLVNITANEVLGWEVKLTFYNLIMTGFNPRGQTIDAASRPGEHVVGLASPLPSVGGNVVVADLEFLVTNSSCGWVWGEGVFHSLLGNGLPAYIDGASVGYSLSPPWGVGNALLAVNCQVATETSTFSGVKCLYR